MSDPQPALSTRQRLGPGAELKAALTEAHKLVDDLLSAEMGSLGVNLGEADVLTVLHVAEHHPTPTEVADWLSVTGASTTARLQSLERRGLVERKPNATDRRSVSLHLTAEGQRLAAAVVRAKDTAIVNGLIDRLGPDAAAEVTANLQQVIRVARSLLADEAG